MTKSTAQALTETLISPNEVDRNLEPANVVDGLFAIARALQHIAKAIERLGTNDAATPMGAIEMLSLEIKNASERITEAMHDERF